MQVLWAKNYLNYFIASGLLSVCECGKLLLNYSSVILMRGGGYSCSHLTSFAARFALVPNDLHFTDIEDFFE